VKASRLPGIVLAAIAVQAVALLAAPAARAVEAHAVILLYHHVDSDTPAATSVTPARFGQHLAFLADGGYRVWPLERILAAVYDNAEPLPENVVAITFDDAYESVYTEARPRLAALGWPYTVFVNTDAVDAGHEPYMTWDQLRALARSGAAIGNHSAAHGHMAAPTEGESIAAWEARVSGDIGRAHARLAAEIGRAPAVFAYPYGEDSPALARIVAESYRWALAQRSGAVGASVDPLAIPRFPMATGFAALDRLSRAVDSRPLPVRELATGADGDRGDLDWIRFAVLEEGFRMSRVACFSADGHALPIERIGAESMSVRIDVDGIGRPGRNKINCTAPASDGSGDYYWFSYQWRIDP